MHQKSQSQQSQRQSRQSTVQLKTPRENKTPTQRRRQKLTVFRSKSKNNFLTDAQTSDNTMGKSSSSLQIKLSVMQQKLRRVSKQNGELKECIINMKANQFYTINEQKVKLAISQNERLKKEIISMKKFNEQLLIQNQFLQRNNRNLKTQLQNITSAQLRKSIDIARTSRIRESSKRILPNLNQNIQSNNKELSPIQRLKEEKRIIQQVKSNPNLLKSPINKYQVDSSQFILKERQLNSNKNALQNQRSSKNLLTNKLKNSNEHFLKEFQKYQKQIFPKNQQKQSFQHNNDQDFNNLITPRNKKSFGQDQQIMQSRSKQISLQAILQKKQQMMNHKARQRQNKSKQFKHQYFNQNDQNNPKLANYKIGKPLTNFQKENEGKKQNKYVNIERKKLTNQKINRIKQVSSRQRVYHPRS